MVSGVRCQANLVSEGQTLDPGTCALVTLGRCYNGARAELQELAPNKQWALEAKRSGVSGQPC